MAEATDTPAAIELPEERRAARQLWLAEARAFLTRIGVPENLAEVVAQLEAGKTHRRLFGEWESLSARHRRRRWEEMARATERAAYASRPFCLRCGECCRRHTPVLHLPDLPLLSEGVSESAFGRHQLVTLRRGERAWSPLKDRVIVLTREMIKVRPRAGSGSGPCFDAATGSCAIYERRPLECRALKCWEPGSFEAATRAPYLSRRDVLTAEPELVALVARHEREADCGLALKLLAGGGSGARAGFAQIIEADRKLRGEAVSLGVGPAELDFLLGRPLRDTLPDVVSEAVGPDTGGAGRQP